MRYSIALRLTVLLRTAQTTKSQQARPPCEWHIPHGDPQNTWDNNGILPGETELPCAGSLAYYEGTYATTREMCDSEFCPDCEYGHYCDQMCGFSLPANENLYAARMGKGACAAIIASGQASCEADFCPDCGDLAHYCDAACGYCIPVNDVHPGSVCVPEFFSAWDVWNSVGCSPTDGQAHCSDECNSMLSAIIAVTEVDCVDHDLALLPIHNADPSSEPQHVGTWLSGVVRSDELCNPTACSTLMLDADEMCIYGTGDENFEYGCDTAGCVQARQNLETHRFNCTGERDELLYHGNDFATYTLWVEHECRLCHPGAIVDACAQEATNPDSTCHPECQRNVTDFVENRLQECRQVMLGVGYEHSSLQTIEQIYSLCNGMSCVINTPDNSFLGLDGDLPCEHTGVLHPGERCQIVCNNGFDAEGDGIAECVGDGQIELDLYCHEQDCYQPIVFPAHVSPGDCDIHPLAGGMPGEVEVHLPRGSSCQPICIDGYVSNGQAVVCETHPSTYGGALEHHFECHLPCDISGVTSPRNGQLGTLCNGTDGTLGFGEFCDLTCDEGFELSNQPECVGRGDETHMSFDTATCTATNPTATLASSMTFHMPISNAEEPGFEELYKSLLAAEYSEFVGHTSPSAIQVTSIQLVGVESVRANYTVVVDCTPGCEGGLSCRGDDCIPASTESVDLRTVHANCFSSRCPLHVGPFPTVDPDLVEPIPIVQIQITLDTTIDTVNADRAEFELNFQNSVAATLGIARSLIVITAIDSGSIIVTFTIANQENAAAITATLEQATIAGYEVIRSPGPSPTPAPVPPSPVLANEPTCTNNNELCQSWAESDQCSVNSIFMQESCSLWCDPECESQRPVLVPTPLPGTTVEIPEETKASEDSEGGNMGVLVALVLLLVVGGGGAVAYLKLGQSPQPGNHTEVEVPFEEPTKEGVGADGHLQEDEHEDNPLAEFDVEATGDDDDVVDT